LKNRKDIILLLAGLLITIIYILVFKPVTEFGDAPTYLRYAQVIAVNGDTGTFLSCSPFYPWLLYLIISAFGKSIAVNAMIILQYLLLYTSIALIYSIIKAWYDKWPIVLLTVLLAMINLSAIYYGFMLQTETLTMFFLIFSVWLVLDGISRSSSIRLSFSGISISLMILSRFNTLPMVLVFLVIISILTYLQDDFKLIKAVQYMAAFLIPVLIILNGYAFLNYQKHGFYGLFPLGGSEIVSRNALIATIDGSEIVSEDSKPVLAIFQKAGEEVNANPISEKKGSLTRFDKFHFTDKLYKGFKIYSAALPELCRYFNIDSDIPEPDMSGKLAPFYYEIRQQNQSEIWSIRFLSLLSSLRSSSGLVISENPDSHLGRLPAWIIIVYKLIVFLFSSMVFVCSIFYIIRCILKSARPAPIILLFILVIFGFFLINFTFATAGDANRFKYPAEPLIISLGVYYSHAAYIFLKQKIF
jgi:hypothetical protein